MSRCEVARLVRGGWSGVAGGRPGGPELTVVDF